MKKSIRITNENRDYLWALSDARYARERVTINPGKSRPSTAADAKARERDIRDMLNAEGITWSGDLRARGANRPDIAVKTADGIRLIIEVKHGGGALGYAAVAGLDTFPESRDPEYCLLDVDYVVYHAEQTLTDRRDIACEYMVSTREDFLEMLVEYCHGTRSGGWLTATKLSKDDTQINIQSQYVGNFWEGIQSDPRAVTLWDFCTEVLGREPRWER